MDIFGHSKFIPVFLGKIVRKNLEQPFLAIPILYQSFWEKLSEKIWNGHFWSFQICTSLFGKNCQENSEWSFWEKLSEKKLEWPFLAILNLYQSFWKKLSEKFGTAIFGHSKFIPVFLRKLSEKIQNGHFWSF